MSEFKKITETVAALKQKTGDAPRIAAVLGSGLSGFAERLENATTIPYGDLPHWPHSTVKGHPGNLVVGDLAGKRVAAMAGRVHLYEGHDPATVVFPARVLRHWGAEVLLVTNSAGGIRSDLQPGTLMLISDHLNLQFRNPLYGENEDELGPRFPDMTEAYDAKLREVARAAAAKVGVDLKEGIYAALLGPSYETPAEIRMFEVWGVDAVGMSTVPEVIAVRHMGMRVLGISCISNLAAGLSDQPLSHEEVTETAAKVRGQFEGLLAAIIEKI